MGPKRVKGNGQAHLSSPYFTQWVSSSLEGLQVVRSPGSLDPKISEVLPSPNSCPPKSWQLDTWGQARASGPTGGPRGRCCGGIQQLRGEPMRGQVGQDPKPCRAQWVTERASQVCLQRNPKRGAWKRGGDGHRREAAATRASQEVKDCPGADAVMSAARQQPDRTCSRGCSPTTPLRNE